jgi:hypothetical protein
MLTKLQHLIQNNTIAMIPIFIIVIYGSIFVYPILRIIIILVLLIYSIRLQLTAIN